MRREEETLGKRRVVYLDLPSGRFLLLPDDKLFASLSDEQFAPPAPEPDDTTGEFYLHTGPIQTSYENIGAEQLNGRTTRKYRVVVNGLESANVNEGETLIWVDESLGMPVKSVTKSPAGTRTMELSELSLEVDKSLFRIPPDFRKIDAQMLRQQLR